MSGATPPDDHGPEPHDRSWLDVRIQQARNPPPPVFRAVVANLAVAIVGAIILLAWDWMASRYPRLPDVGLGLTAIFVVTVLVAGSLLTYLWVELPTGATGVKRRSPWAALLGFFAAVPIVYLVLVVTMQVVRPLLG